MQLTANQKTLDLDKPVVMGILNVTPDSFSDGGKFVDVDRAITHAKQMMAQGASIIDVGGESTRPGAQPVTIDDELERVVPVIEALTSLDVWISVDTSKAEVMTAAAGAGADLINDVCALRQAGAIEAAAATGLPICLMHMQGEPRTMQADPSYDDVLHDVSEFLTDRIEACELAGIAPDRLVLDPGFGFGKTLAHNLELLANLDHLIESFELPLLVGVSRKSMFGQLLNAPLDQRLAGGLAAAVAAAQQGAHIIRVHDVRETVDALTVLAALDNHRR